jgi:hypothetical protein
MPVIQTQLVPFTVRDSNMSQTDSRYLLTLQAANPFMAVDTSAGSEEYQLPPAGTQASTGQSYQNVELVFRKVSTDSNAFTILGSADGPLILSTPGPSAVIRVKSNGTQWFQV